MPMPKNELPEKEDPGSEPHGKTGDEWRKDRPALARLETDAEAGNGETAREAIERSRAEEQPRTKQQDSK